MISNNILFYRPRRGRVETEIKQPREAELHSHKDKTLRHIKAIQLRMTGTVHTFFFFLFLFLLIIIEMLSQILK